MTGILAFSVIVALLFLREIWLLFVSIVKVAMECIGVVDGKKDQVAERDVLEADRDWVGHDRARFNR